MTQSLKVLTVGTVAGLVMLSFAFLTLPSFTNAAEYAYVDAQGEVKTVTAGDWMTAIATALNIHIHSGVFLLKSAADYAVVGDNIEGAN
jgi:hypothetical protein